MKKLMLMFFLCIVLLNSVSAVDTFFKTHGQTQTAQAGDTAGRGLIFYTTNPGNLTGVTKYTDSVGTGVKLYSPNGTEIANATWSGNNATFTTPIQLANQTYYVICQYGQTNSAWKDPGAFPYNTIVNITFVASQDCGSGFLNQTNVVREFSGITMQYGSTTPPVLYPTLNLTLPANNGNATQQVEFVITANSSNASIQLTNVTFFLNGVLNETKSITGTSNITSFFRNVSLVQNNWTAYICDAYNCSLAHSNFSFTAQKLIKLNETYVNPDLGGSTSQFDLVVNTSSGYSVVIPYFHYNNTQYVGQFTQIGNYYYITSTITLPFSSTQQNKSFYWNISISDSTYVRTPTQTQTVNALAIDNCTTNNNTIFNFTILDEEFLFLMNHTSVEYSFNIYDNTRTNILMTENRTVTTNPTRLCLSNPLTNVTSFSLDGTLKYYGNSSYAIRYYNILNFTLMNSTTPVNTFLYLVNNSISLPFLLTFRDSGLALAPNILVKVNRQYLATNNYRTVEIPKTDTGGQTILNLVRNDVIYNIMMVNSSGSIVASFSNVVAFCQDFTIGSCTLDLSTPGTSSQSYNYNASVGISYAISYSNASKLISLAFNSLNSSVMQVRMVTRTENQFQNQTICDSSLTTTSGSLSCNISSAVATNQYFFVDVYANGKYIETYSLNANSSLSTDGPAFGTGGLFIAALFLLLITMLFSDDKQTLVIMLGIGWVIVIALGLVNGAIFGLTSGGIWLIISLIIVLWKLKQEEYPT
jgi:hypothetical protein